VRCALAIVIGLFAVGCGGGDDEPTARTTPEPTATATPEGRFEVAYKLPRDIAQRLHKGRAQELILEEGEVIARSDFDAGTSYPLRDWLENRGIEVEDPGKLTPMWLSVEKNQSLYLMIMTTDDRVADALDELQPSKRRLAAVYNRWSRKRVPDGGEAMADWLRIFRLAVRAGDRRNVVIIPDPH
jgi:hypothetical protein